MKKIIIAILFISAYELIAIPRFAIMRGNQCKDCHSNPTGGLIRNEDGWTYGKNNLRVFRSSQNSISPFLNENISIGFDFRFQYLYSQELRKTDFHKMAGGVYTNFVLNDELDFIAKYDLYRGYFEGYGILKISPLKSYMKIGSFSPNFGLRLDDHTAYTRNGDKGVVSPQMVQGLIFSPDYSLTGIELGFYPDDFLFITVDIGQNNFPFRTEPSYIGRVELTPSIKNLNLILGGSYGIFRKIQDKFELASLFSGFGFKNFSLLSEVVFSKDYMDKNIYSQAVMIESSLRVSHGIDFVIRYDRFLPDIKQKINYTSHLIIGFDLFLYSFFEIKPQFRFNLENPKIEKNNSFIMQFHFWY